MNEPAAPQPKLTPEQQEHYNGWKHSWLVLAIGIVLVLISFWVFVRSTNNKQDTSLDTQTEQIAVQNCRGKYAAALSSAQVDNQLAQNTNSAAIDALVAAGLAQRTTDLAAEFKDVADAKTEMEKTGMALSEARDQRNAFEEHPTGTC